MAISVNILRLRLTTDLTPRTKNGQPDHRTTGVASTSSAQAAIPPPIQLRKGRPTMGPIVSSRTGIVRAAPIRKRRVKSTSSGLGPVSPTGTPFGSSAMPQLGQSEGPSDSISGHMGQM